MVNNFHFSFQQFFENKINDDTNPREQNICKDLWDAFSLIRKKLKKELDTTYALYPHYSKHDFSHSENIIVSVEKLLSKEQWDDFFVLDAWMFLCCAYIHDIGMIVYYDELLKDWNSMEFQNYLRECAISNDKSMRIAAEHMLSENINIKNISPLAIRREVMLLAADFYRSKHTKRIKEKAEDILKNFFLEVVEIYGISNNILEKLSDISAMHGGTFELMISNLNKSDMLLGLTYHPRFVAALLRIGDLCDFDDNRFSSQWLMTNGGLTKTNLVHYFKHLFVKYKLISPKEINVIVNVDSKKMDKEIENLKLLEKGLYIETDNDKHNFISKIIKEANNWFGWLKEEIYNIKSYWSCIMPDNMPLFETDYNYKILLDGSELLFTSNNLKFMFSQEKAYHLIESYNLYNNQLIFVREVIQNSLDALKMKFWHELRRGNYDHLILEDRLEALRDVEQHVNYAKLKPFDFKDNSIYEKFQIEIFAEQDIDKSTFKFSIEDNGVGISKKDFEDKIVNTGQSWNGKKGKDDLMSIPEWLRPSGAFGIGLHSIFGVSDRIYIRTRPENEDKEYEITLNSGMKDGYVFMSECHDKEKTYCGRRGSGTYLEIYIDKEKYKSERTDEEWKDKNPFEKRPKGVICVAVEKVIKQNIIFPLFKIKYNCGESSSYISSLADSKLFYPLFNHNRRNKILSSKFDFKLDFAFDLYGRAIVIWNQELCTVYRFTFDRVQNSSYCYRGILINDRRDIQEILPNIWLENTNIMRDSSDYVLTVSRDDFVLAWLENFKANSANMGIIIADIYYNLILKVYTDSYVQKWINDLEDSLKMSLASNRRKEFIVNDAIKLSKKYKMESNLGFYYTYFFHGLRRVLNTQGELLKLYLEKNRIEIIEERLFSEAGKERKAYMSNNSSLFEIIELCENVVEYIIDKLPLEVNESKKQFSESILRSFEDNLHVIHIEEIEGVFQNVFADLFGFGELNEVAFYLQEEFISNFDIFYKSSRSDRKPYHDIGGHDFGWSYIDEVRACVGNDDWPNLEKKFIKECYMNFSIESINYFNCLPLYWIVYFIMGTVGSGKLSNLKPILEDKRFSGCNVSESNCFVMGKQDLADIITSPYIQIRNRHLFKRDNVMRAWHDWGLDSIDLDNNLELILTYNTINIGLKLIKIKNLLVLKRYLLEYDDDSVIPAYLGLEDIALKGKEINSWAKVCTYKCKFIYLWKKYAEIDKYNIKSESDKINLINGLMEDKGEEGERIRNLIDYICYCKYIKSKNGECEYDFLRRKIRETYKVFMSDVLDCTYLSDKELALRIPGGKVK